MRSVVAFCAASAAFLCALSSGLTPGPAAARQKAPVVVESTTSRLTPAPYERIAIADLERVPIGSEIEIVGYFSHKSPEIDGDLEVYLIDHHGYFVVVEAPRRYKEMKYYVRSLHLHRNELVMARGTLTQQRDKPTMHYTRGWLEINPVETMARYVGPMPPDLHYVRVVHHMFGQAHVTNM